MRVRLRMLRLALARALFLAALIQLRQNLGAGRAETVPPIPSIRSGALNYCFRLMHIADPRQVPTGLFLYTLRPIRLAMLTDGATPDEQALAGSFSVSTHAYGRVAERSRHRSARGPATLRLHVAVSQRRSDLAGACTGHSSIYEQLAVHLSRACVFRR